MIVKKFHVLLFVLLMAFLSSYSQSLINGNITGDSSNALIGVTVSAGKAGTVTDENGNYQLKLAAGNYIITYSYIGFENQTKNISLKENETLIVNLQLHSTANELNLIVVSASRYEKNITEETVSMEVLKPDFIKNVNAIGMNDVMKQLPGVTLIDNQANIRGGSGFSYGAGSRVLMLVDDIPQLTADANDIKWEFIPVENLNQIEVIKGASSVLYGSSALNGVINARTNYPTSVPQTQINFYSGYFLNPNRDEIIWWGNQQPNFAGGNFMHSKKIGQLDLVLGGNLYNEKSYHEGEYTQRGRINANTRYRFKNIDGLSVGLNTNYMYYQSGTYFLWADDTLGAYRPLGGLDTATTTISEGKNTRWNVDPFVNYFTKNGDHHSLKMRYFYTRNNNNTNQGSTAKLYYGEYQYQKQFHFGMSLIAGITANYSDVSAELYNDHTANNFAAFTQADKKFGKLSVVAGVRYETFSVDTANGTSKPVVRAGINYPLTKKTFLRASFGQGYRFPSIAEKYVSTSISLLKVFPNPEVQPEYGWTAEVGVKQAFKISNWTGYVDVAAFVQRYNDLIEFSFGYYDPNPIPDFININYLGFKSINIDNARITGAELSIIGEGNIGKLKINMLAGLTFINPINIDQKNFIDSVLGSTDGLSQYEIDSLNQTKILNYRFETTAKISLDMAYKKFSCGINFQYNSFMKNIDLFFLGTDPLLIYIYGKPTEFIPGVAEYRAFHDKGDFTFDLRLSYDLSEKVRFSFITKNLFNREYMVRPALLEAPRSVQAMVSVRL